MDWQGIGGGEGGCVADRSQGGETKKWEGGGCVCLEVVSEA